MKTIFLMLGFFTKIPVPQTEYSEERYVRGLKFVPFIGLLVGIILYAVSYTSMIFDPPVTAFLITFSYLIITGGIHLDGMADSCDGLFSGRDRAKILEIMQDSRSGAYGVISLVLWFSFMLIFLTYLPYEALIIMPMVGKSGSLISGTLGNYAKKDGLGRVFTENCGALEVLLSILLPLIFIILIELISGNALIKCLIFAVATLLSVLFSIVFTLRLNRTIGGVTGDTLGFVCEVCQVIFLAISYVGIKVI